MGLLDYSTNPANNGVVAGVTYWPAGMFMSQTDNAGRQNMADLASWLLAPTLNGPATINGNILLNAATPTITFNTGGPRIASNGANRLAFFVDGGANERMTLDSSGGLNVFGPRNLGSNNNIAGSGSARVIAAVPGGHAITAYDTQDFTAVQFVRDEAGIAQQKGTIVVTTAGTSYNTTSDYRLKEIDGPVTDGMAFIRALRPVEGRWKADGSRFVGLIAHEAQEVAETRIAQGEKDGVETQTLGYASPEVMAKLIAAMQQMDERLTAAGL